jgi:hypothetical protein
MQPDANLGHEWVGPNASVWMRRIAEKARWRRAGPIGPGRMRAEAMRRPRDAKS